jgi:hypothetical protein
MPPEGFRRLELRVPDWRRQQLSATISRVDAVHLYHALQSEIGLFVELQERVHPRYGVAIDRTAALTIRRAIDDAWTRLASAGNRVER